MGDRRTVPALLVFDLDGTLLDEGHAIPSEVRELLFVLREQGIETTLATGRPFAAVGQFCRDLELKLPLITFNGAVTIDPTGRILRQRALPLGSARAILQLLEDADVANQLYLTPEDNHFHTDTEDSAASYITEKDGLACRFSPSLLNILDRAERDPVKMFSIGPRESLEQVRSLVLASDLEVSCMFSESDMLEFLAPGVNKGEALRTLCDELTLSPNDIWTFGDNMNDLEMLQFAGTGVAMCSAPAELLAAANDVTDNLETFLRNNLLDEKGR